MKLALSMIVQGTGEEPQQLERLLPTIAPYVDGIFITITSPKELVPEVIKVCEKYKAVISYESALWTVDKKQYNWVKNLLGHEPHSQIGDKIFQFDVARNFNFTTIPASFDFIIWLDCDDVFVNGEKLKHVRDLMESNTLDSMFMNYIYQAEFNPDGSVRQVIIEHLRERIVRRGKYRWVMPIHETLIELLPTRKSDNYDCHVMHLAVRKDHEESIFRNLKNLELAIYKTEGKDPRQLYYLSKSYIDLSMLGKKEYLDYAIPLLEKYLNGENKSGWPEERAQAWQYLCEIYREKGEFNNAVKCIANALIEAPEDPSLFLSMATIYSTKGEWERALFWVKLCTSIKQKKTTLVNNPRDTKIRILQVIYNSCLNLGQIDEAWASAQKMVEFYPDDPSFRDALNFMTQLRSDRDLTNYYLRIVKQLESTGESDKIKTLLMSAPNSIINNPFLINLWQQYNPAKEWEDKEIAIFCGQGFTPWSPKSLYDPKQTFVGGSEEAVIRMSAELQKLGWKVTVYADPAGDEGDYDGVQWLPYYKFNKRDKFNILVVWRNVGFVDQDLSTKKTYIWNHDIQNMQDWTEERLKKITKGIFLSKWHRENVKNVPEEKIFYSSNGI